MLDSVAHRVKEVERFLYLDSVFGYHSVSEDLEHDFPRPEELPKKVKFSSQSSTSS